MRPLFALISLAALATPAMAQTDALSDETAMQARTLMENALESDVAYDTIRDLTTRIGPRLAGSEAEARARDWAVDHLKSLGFKNVRVEPFDMPFWSRVSEHAEIVSPFPQPLAITALGNSVATPEGGVTGEIVRFETMNDLAAAPMDDSLKGKIVFVDEDMVRTQDGSSYGVAVAKRSGAANEAAKRGAVAAIIKSVGTDTFRRPHTGTMRYIDGGTKVPTAALAWPDAEQLTRALAYGPVTVRLDISVLTKDSVESGNVIAEIPGKTDELVVIGGHLDSWDLGTGAVDDGAGIGIVTGAGKVILDLKKKPERTIRIVYFGAEEVGLLGAFAYAKAHATELDKHVVGAESDFGAGRIYQLRSRFGESQLDKAAAMQRVLEPLGIALADNEGTGGPDMTPLRTAGVPVVSLSQNGWDYFDLHHTSDDTFDKIDPDDIAQNVAAYAAFAWMAANMEGSFRDAPAAD
ncbi:M28 family peptidase [Parvularcula sp. LCG005]|uniref:M28 family peptidase n=1 Tax=Parvularcula sp. LCG005 TaxID=3078805 RepID=UPI0029436509|nr:M28 family peptidase [Parvularcula sp. LCG005]WOI53216.1 M28 family peptidase [Parvularcula sp. LCG005]